MDHTQKDTRYPNVLISKDFVYFGATGPKIPSEFQSNYEKPLVKQGVGYFKIDDELMFHHFEKWVRSQEDWGCSGEPWDWHVRLKLDKRGESK